MSIIDLNITHKLLCLYNLWGVSEIKPLKAYTQNICPWKEKILLENLRCIYIKTHYGDKNIDTLTLLKYLCYKTPVKILRKRDKPVKKKPIHYKQVVFVGKREITVLET